MPERNRHESPKLRRLRRGFHLGATLTLLLALPAQAAPFVFASLPDTQIYADDRFPGHEETPAITDPRGTGAIFHDQTRWLVEQADALGIGYVAHLGDIVHKGDDLDQWALAEDAMGLLLEADIPHGTVMGNHDRSHGPDYRFNYLDNFGPQRFAGRPWYTASSPAGGANFQQIEHEHYKLGFLNFSLDHPQAEIDWAMDLVSANPDTIFIIGTHRYLADFKLAAGRFGEEVDTLLGPITLPVRIQSRVVDSHSGEEFFHEFVRRHPNVLMVHAGHVHSDWLRLDEQNDAAQTIVQILSNYQDARNGGDGWLRLYELDFDAGELRFHTYSPTLDRRRTTIDHFVESIFLVYDQRANFMEAIGIEDEEVYFGLIPFVLKDGPAPDGFLLGHPDLDEPEERAYYEQYLLDLFEGDPPPGFDDLLEWEQLWMLAFAASEDPLDFSEGSRSPSGVIPIDFAAYFTPSRSQSIGFAFRALLDGLAELGAEDLAWPSARRWLTRLAHFAYKRALTDRTDHARFLLSFFEDRTDGCAERGEPDTLRSGATLWEWLWAWFHRDFVSTCEGQATIHPAVLELNELLDRSTD